MTQETNKEVVIAVVCVDWRMHHPESNFPKALYEYLGCNRVYEVTYPGPDAMCDGLECADHRKSFETIVAQTRSVLAAHGVASSRKVIVVHSECAGHSVSDDEHREHGITLATQLNAELKVATPFEPLIAIKDGDDMRWRVESC